MSAVASKPTAAAVLLGEDGRGYELARRLEGCGSWRAWLGDAAYASFAQALASPATWEAFLGPPANRAHLVLQLRARALLFDKASAALDVGCGGAVRLATDLNPNYVQLHGDDIYHSLEDMKDGVQNQAPPKAIMNPCTLKDHPSEKAVVGSKYHESESLSTSQRHRGEELPDAWYNKFAQNRIKSNMNMYNVTEFQMKTSAGIVVKEIQMRTSDGMVDYLKVCNAQKKKRKTFKSDQAGSAYINTMVENGASMSRNLASGPADSKDEECILLPEITFPSNCVPDCAFSLIHEIEKNEKVEVCQVLDNLPSVTNRNAAMIERFGIIPEYYKMGTKYRGRDGSGGKREPLGQVEACKISNKVVARLLDTMGFEGGSEASINVFSEILSSHICKLGRTLKLLSDSYKKQYSSIELIKMFLQSSGHSLGGLAEIVKDVNKVFPQQTQPVRALPLPNQSPFMQASNQYQRQMQQIGALYPNLTIQQKQQLYQQLRRRQTANSRGSTVNMNPDQPLVEVKLENVMDSQMDGSLNAYNKQQLLQFRQQQMALTDHSGQSSQPFKQMPNVQLPQLQAQNAYNMRTPSVKVEALNDLIGGDSTFKQ